MAAAATGAAVVGSALPATAQRAVGEEKATLAHGKSRRHGDIRDVQHVVILMQENRSFDHYFGSLQGVRGFGDRSTITLPGGVSVFEQPTTPPGSPVTSTHFPWRLSAAPPSAYPPDHRPPNSEVGAQGYGGTTHSWDDQHAAWYGGLMNGWVYAKGGLTTLGYLNRHDIPYQYALADAYTIGDAYHCSVLSATGPNRTYLWSGTIDAQQKYSDFVAYNGGDELGKFLLWESYAETLQNAGVSWHVYQCEDDYGDTGTEYFKTFAQYDPTQGGTPAPGNVFYEHGVANVPEPLTGLTANADNLANAIKADVLAGSLPQVSWVVTNQAFSEHPDGAPNDGAYCVDRILHALHADPEVFNSTLLIIDYDENDGQFDHVPPPVPAPGTRDEFYLEPTGALADAGLTEPLPVGLGFRVPLLLISPWTRGGWVTSEVSDHTSVIQFLEKWTEVLGTPAICPNISGWRRSVCGDLTGAFDFAAPVFGLPRLPTTTVIGDPPDGQYDPPPVANSLPKQETGHKRARPLPYQPNANLDGFVIDTNGARANLSLSNNGPHVQRAAHFTIYDNTAGTPTLADYPSKYPGQYTVDPRRTGRHQTVRATAAVAGSTYDLTVVGPNRFLRRYTGDLDHAGKTANAKLTYYRGTLGPQPRLLFELINRASSPVTFTITSNNYATEPAQTYRVAGHNHLTPAALDPLTSTDGWYDYTVTIDSDPTWSRRYVGHLENGANSTTG